MRLGGVLRKFAISLAATALVAGAPATAQASSSKIDPNLKALVASSSPTAELHVVVFGKDVGTASTATKAKVRHKLGSFSAEALTVTPAQLEALAAAGGVNRIVPDTPVVPTAAGSPVSFPALSTLYPKLDGMQTVWNSGYTGAGVGIAVLDSGIVTSQPDFGSRLVQVTLPGQTSAADTFGHGTFVAGVAAGSSANGAYVGIAPGANVYGLNVARPDGVYTSDVIAGLDWVLANHAKYNIRVANLSLAESTASSYLSDALDTDVERVWRDGVVVVASAGNRGAGSTSFAPGNDPFAITVGAIDSNDTLATSDDIVASFSSSGKTSDGYDKPELLAPGRHIASILATTSTLGGQAPAANVLAGGYATMSGTSFAAPQVAGAAAILFQEHPTYTPDQIKWLIAQTGHSLPSAMGVSLDIAAATAFTGTPGSANQGLVQTTYGLVASGTGTVTSATWNSATWNSATWNSATWNSATWNSAAWN